MLKDERPANSWLHGYRPEPGRVLMPVVEPSKATLVYLAAMERARVTCAENRHAPAMVMSDEIHRPKPRSMPEFTADDLVFDHCVNLNHPKHQKPMKAKTGPGPVVNRFCPAQKQAGRIAHARLTAKAERFA